MFMSNLSCVAACCIRAKRVFLSGGMLVAFSAALRLTAADYDVKQFGATGDGKTIDTDAINKAIVAAHAAGGGIVRFPAGTYLSVSIQLQSNIGLFLEPGCVIEAADRTVKFYDAPETNEWDGKYLDFGHTHWHNSLIWGVGLDNVSISGPGLIYGKGLLKAIALPPGSGNKAIGLENCRNVTLRDFSIRHGGHFGVLATGVDNLTIDNLKIDTDRDGMDIDCCNNVRISNCSVNSPSDDAICLKSTYALGYPRPTENVNIVNCHVSGYVEGTMLDGTRDASNTNKSPMHIKGFEPVGGIKFGTEASGGFKNITVANCTFEHCRGLALEEVDGGNLEDVSVSNLAMRDVSDAAIFIRLGNRARGPNNPPVGFLRRVNIDNVVASGINPRCGVIISGLPGHPIEDITLSNIRLLCRGGGTKADATNQPAELEKGYPEAITFGVLPAYGLYLRHVDGVSLRGVNIRCTTNDLRPAFVLDDVTNADLVDIKPSWSPRLFSPGKGHSGNRFPY